MPEPCDRSRAGLCGPKLSSHREANTEADLLKDKEPAGSPQSTPELPPIVGQGHEDESYTQ